MPSDKERSSMKPPLTPIALVVVALAAAGLAAHRIFSDETASATTGVGFSTTILARGIFGENFTFGTPTQITVKRKVSIKTKSGVVTKTVKFKVDSVLRAITCAPTKPCDTAFQQARVEPGGSSGWHTHPGATFVAVVQGEGTLYRVVGSGCTSTKLSAGAGFAQMPTERHVVRNEGAVPFVVDTLYVLPPGTANTGIRVDQPQPTECPSIN
jgi:mannose-6-phosphate isomerase-like protein (cupin superfamily)